MDYLHTTSSKHYWKTLNRIMKYIDDYNYKLIKTWIRNINRIHIPEAKRMGYYGYLASLNGQIKAYEDILKMIKEKSDEL